MRLRRFIPIGIIGFLILLSALVYITDRGFDTTLSFTLKDRVSKDWVWDATITFQNRTIRSYYQSDRGPRKYRFDHLKPRTGGLEISAPGYQPVSLTVELKRGDNEIARAIEMTGLGIPDLQYLLLFEKTEGLNVRVELRPVGSDGTAILNHPCMDLWIGARETVQMNDQGTAMQPMESGAIRGEELFRGQIEWEWNGAPETVFRYTALIPGSKIRKHDAPYRIVDYLIVVPKPFSSGDSDIEAIVEAAWKQAEPENLRDTLDAYSDIFSYYIHTSWNVGRGE